MLSCLESGLPPSECLAEDTSRKQRRTWERSGSFEGTWTEKDEAELAKKEPGDNVKDGVLIDSRCHVTVQC